MRGQRSRAAAGVLVVAASVALAACRGDASPQPARPDVAAMRAELATYAGSTANFDQVRAVVAATSDEVLLEKYYGGTGPRRTWDVQSVTKSVISTLVGIALDEGLIDGVDATLAELLPRQVDAMSSVVAGTTLRQLLTMDAGFPEPLDPFAAPFEGSRDWIRTILRAPERPPGEGFSYSNPTSHLLAAILVEATGTTVLRYARSRLLDPLGIDSRPALEDRLGGPVGVAELRAAGFAWARDPQGLHTGWWGLKLRPRDLVRLGRLVLADGIWDRVQLVSGAWLDEATSTQVPASGLGSGYGYQWWTVEVDGEEAAAALGYGGQMVLVVPARDLVVVTATDVRYGDATSHGIDLVVLRTVVEDAIVRHVPDVA